MLGDGISWAEFYELPFTVGVALAGCVFGLVDRMNIIAQLPDAQEVMLREIEEDKIAELNGGPDMRFTKAGVIALVSAMQRNVHKKFVCASLADVRGGGERGKHPQYCFTTRGNRSVGS